MANCVGGTQTTREIAFKKSNVELTQRNPNIKNAVRKCYWMLFFFIKVNKVAGIFLRILLAKKTAITMLLTTVYS